VLRGTPNVVHLRGFSEPLLLQDPINMQLCELESPLIHALLLRIVHLCISGIYFG